MSNGRLEIRLKPRAKNDRMTVHESGRIDIAVTSPPLDGKANEHLIRFLAERIGVPIARLSLIRGGHSRNKIVAVEGMTTDEAMRRMTT